MLKLQRLLLPTDFSESARHAFLYASSFAREYGAELHLIHVVEVLPVGYTSELFPTAMTQVLDEISTYARSEMTKLADEARRQNLVVYEHIAQGRPALEVIRVASELEIDLIVIGTHGRGALSHALFGSTAEKVVRKAPCPVLLCRQTTRDFVTD